MQNNGIKKDVFYRLCISVTNKSHAKEDIFSTIGRHDLLEK